MTRPINIGEDARHFFAGIPQANREPIKKALTRPENSTLLKISADAQTNAAAERTAGDGMIEQARVLLQPGPKQRRYHHHHHHNNSGVGRRVSGANVRRSWRMGLSRRSGTVDQTPDLKTWVAEIK
jgi:hypothetical protein